VKLEASLYPAVKQEPFAEFLLLSGSSLKSVEQELILSLFFCIAVRNGAWQKMEYAVLDMAVKNIQAEFPNVARNVPTALNELLRAGYIIRRGEGKKILLTPTPTFAALVGATRKTPLI
jgi:hypothetical protein